MAQITLCVFDAYGTLFDVHAAIGRHAAAVGPQAGEVSRLWRLKQLEYTWTRSLMGRHADFWTLTQEALDFALATFGIRDPGLRRSLLEAYRVLDAYPEVRPVLQRLKDAGLALAILSNGSPQMLADAVSAARIGPLLDAVLSVEAEGIYKPDARVYRLVCKRFALEPAQVSFQSSNAWDAAGARAFGFSVAWINRSGQPPEYGFAPPTRTLASLEALPDALLQA
jgi:2-haloacid dehalogenase